MAIFMAGLLNHKPDFFTRRKSGLFLADFGTEAFVNLR